MTPEDIAKRVKRQFGDESGVQVTNDDILMWMNDAVREAYIQNPSISIQNVGVDSVVGDPIILVDNGGTYNIHQVYYREAGTGYYRPLQYLTPVAMDAYLEGWRPSSVPSVVTGNPEYYTKYANTGICVYPAPDRSEVDAFMYTGTKTHDELTSLETSVIPLPANYHMYVLEYCLMKAYEMDEDWAAADRKAVFIQSTLNVLSATDSDANQSKYPVIFPVTEDYI